MPKGKNKGVEKAGKTDALEKKIYPLCDFLNDLRDELRLAKYRRYCFVLGAGASWSSGILTGRDLATNWLKEMFLREHQQYVVNIFVLRK